MQFSTSCYKLRSLIQISHTQIPNTIMSTAALITGARVAPFIDIRPDVQSLTSLCDANKFRVDSILVNSSELTSDPRKKMYSTKDEYRRAFVDFLRDSTEQFLIYFYCGHGSHQWVSSRNNNVECLCIAEYYNYWYRDYELTEDIDKYLPVGKTLYVIVDACNSGGMINLWHLDTRLEKSVTFFCGANTEVLSWDDPNARGGLFTNSFCRHAKIGRPLWEIADKVLQEIFSPSEEYARSPSIRYSHPAMAVRTFCEN